MSEGNNREERAQRPKFFGILIVIGLLILIFLVRSRQNINDQRALEIGEFWEALEQGRVKSVDMEGNDIEGEFHQGEEKYKYFKTVFPEKYLITEKRYSKELGRDISVIDYIISKVGEGNFHYTEPNTFLYNLLAPLPWLFLILIIWILVTRQMRIQANTGGGVFTFSRSRAKLTMPGKVSVTFDDVAGIDEAKEEVKEIIEFLKNPKRFEKIGGRVPRGVLLVGQPGTGKTLLAKAIAGEAGVPFFSICGSDFVEMFVGVGASRVRDLFRQAKEKAPCIVFLDEIDAVGRRRGTGLGGGHDEREQTLNAILVEMDGFETDRSLIMIAATNRPDVLDPALLRPGRFDREIVLDLPDIKGREEILKVHAKKVRLSSNVDISVVARGTPGFSGADLEATINEAAILAVMKNKERIELDELEEARDKIIWGRQKRSKIMSEKDRMITAYHESGHALVALSIPEIEPLHKVTIIPRGSTLGATMQLPKEDKYHMGRKYLLGRITVLYGGRIAEEITLGDTSAGARDDIGRASELARSMVCEWGMSETVGPISYTDQEEHLFLGREVTRTKRHSEATLQQIDQEIKRIIDECYSNCRKILVENRTSLEKLANALIKNESLTAKEVQEIVGKITS